MINRIRKVASLQPGNGESAGAGILRALQLFGFNLGPIDGSLARYVPGSRLVKKDANFTVTAADHGKTFAFDNGAASVVASLPAVTPAIAGVTVTFVAEQLAGAGAGHAVSPAAADQIIGNGFTPADNKDAILAAASDRLGDSITLVADGELGWYITAVTGTWAREA